MTKRYFTHSAEQTAEVGAQLADTLRCGDFVAMFGDLGVGKTAFVRGMARRLAPTAAVSSPSYALCHSYAGAVTLNHLDLYRILSEDDLESIGFYDLITEGITVAEWCERIPASIPQNAVRVTITRIDGEEEGRCIEITLP